MKAPLIATPPGSTPPGAGAGLPPFDYQPLGRVIYEPGGVARLGEVVRSVGGSRVLLVTDPGLEDDAPQGLVIKRRQRAVGQGARPTAGRGG